MTYAQMVELVKAMDEMQKEGQSRIHLGQLQLQCCYSGDPLPDLTRIGKEDFEVFQSAVKALEDQKTRLEDRESSALKRESELQAELDVLKQEKTALENERQQFFEAAKVQNEEAITLKQRIAQLLLVQEEAISDIGSIYTTTTELGVSRNTQKLESETEMLRTQVAECRLEGAEAEALKREMDLCEDILVGVLNGDDSRKLYLQMTVVKNRMVQSRGRQVMRDAEKMATSIRSTMTLLLENSRSLEKSKSKIKEELLKKLGTPTRTPAKSPPSEVNRYRASSRLMPPKPVIVTMESITSPMGSPQTTTIKEGFDLSMIEGRKSSLSPDKLGFKRDEDVQKLKIDIRRLKEKLEKYRNVERRLVEERARNKIEEKKLKNINQLLSTREKALEEREQALAVNSDLITLEAAKSLSTAEARSLLKIRAQALQEKAEKLYNDQSRLEQDRLNVKALKDEAVELQRMVEKERKRLAKEEVRLANERKKMQGTFEILNGFCRS